MEGNNSCIVLVLVNDYGHIVETGPHAQCKSYGDKLPKELQWGIYEMKEYHSGEREPYKPKQVTPPGEVSE